MDRVAFMSFALTSIKAKLDKSDDGQTNEGQIQDVSAFKIQYYLPYSVYVCLRKSLFDINILTFLILISIGMPCL